MPYAPTDRFTITAAGEGYLDTREAPAAPVEDCRVALGENDPPCGKCPACRALYDLDADDGRDEAFTGAEYTNDLAPLDDGAP